MTTRKKTPKLKPYPKLSIKECRLKQWEDICGKCPKYLYRGRKKTKIESLGFNVSKGYFFTLKDGEHFKPVLALGDELEVDGVKLKAKNY